MASQINYKTLKPHVATYAGAVAIAKVYKPTTTGKTLIKDWTPPPPDDPDLNAKVSVQRTKHYLRFVKHRAANGRFKNRGDVQANSPQGWERVLQKVTSFQGASDASFLETTAAPNTGSPILNSATGTFGVGVVLDDSVVLARSDQRDWARNAALYCLNPDFVGQPTRTSIKQKLVRLLKNQIAHAKFDARISTHHIRGAYPDEGAPSNYWQVVYIVLGLLLHYDDVGLKVNDADFDAFTADENDDFKSWFNGWHEMFDSLVRQQIVKAYPNFYAGNTHSVNTSWINTPKALYWQYNPSNPTSPVIPTSMSYQRFLNNRRGFYFCYALMMAAKFGIGTGRNDFYRWLYYNLRFGCYPDGKSGEEHRLSRGEPAEGLLYTASTVDQLAWGIDLCMKMGWTEHYQLGWIDGVTEGLNGTESPGTPKTLKTMIMYLGTYAKAILPNERYASLAAAQARTSTQRIKFVNVENANINFRVEFGATIMSALAKDADIEDLHLRKASAGYETDKSNQQGVAAKNPDVGFRGLHASLFFEHGDRGGDWDRITNPCDYPTLWTTAYD
jgi:hypothetical protein